MNEQELIEAVRRNDRAAQRQLYDRFSPKMYSICLRYMENRDDAADMLQEGFIKVFTSIERFSNLGSFEGWMRRIFVNVCLENIRQTNILRQGVPIEESEVIEDYDHSVLDRMSADELMVLISEMPPGFRTIFNLFAIEGYSHKEIAEMLGIAEASSRSQFTRAKRYLQERVKRIN
ncbi:MAG: RNA polymerase sigma factor [Bacteroidales bacterium]